MQQINILEHNIYETVFEENFLIVGTCVPRMYPSVFYKFKKEWKNVVFYCLEREHLDLLMAKLFDILALGKTKKVGFLTVDGSPHCVQMHFLSKYLNRGLKTKVEFEHFVINKKGKIFEIDEMKIDKAKNLSEI